MGSSAPVSGWVLLVGKQGGVCPSHRAWPFSSLCPSQAPILSPPRSVSPSVPREQRGPVPQDAHGSLCPAHPGERGQRREGGLDQRPPLPGRVLPVAVRAHLGLVAHEQDGQEEDTELQEWNCECAACPCLLRLLVSLCWLSCCGNVGIALLLTHA